MVRPAVRMLPRAKWLLVGALVLISVVVCCVSWDYTQRNAALLQIPWNARIGATDETCGSSYCTEYGSFEVMMTDTELVRYYQEHGYWCVDRDRHLGVDPSLLPLPYWECERTGLKELAVVRFPKDQETQTLKAYTQFGYEPAL